jgi:hypothetical protein
MPSWAAVSFRENIDMTRMHAKSARFAFVLLAVYAAVYGSTACADDSAPEPQAGVGIVTKSADESVAACYIGDEIAPELRQALGALADKTRTMLDDQDWDGLWELSRAADAENLSKESFIAGMTAAAERLGRPVEGAADDIYVFRFTGEFSGVALCGATAPQDPKHVAVQVASKGEPLALVMRRTRQPPFDRIITYVFRGADGRWRFAGLVGSDVAFMGKGTREYLKAAETYGASGDHLAELVALEIAHAFSKSAPFVERSQSYEVALKIKNLITDSARFDTVRNMKAEGADYIIREVTVETTRTGIRPRLAYLSRHPIDDPRGADEAAALATYIAEHYPSTAKEFSDVLLEAMATPEKGGAKTASKRYLESLVR